MRNQSPQERNKTNNSNTNFTPAVLGVCDAIDLVGRNVSMRSYQNRLLSLGTL